MIGIFYDRHLGSQNSTRKSSIIAREKNNTEQTIWADNAKKVLKKLVRDFNMISSKLYYVRFDFLKLTIYYAANQCF